MPDFSGTAIMFTVLGVAPAGLAWWVLVRLLSLPKVSVRFNALRHSQDTTLTAWITNEPEFNRWLVFAGVRRETVDELFCLLTVTDLTNDVVRIAGVQSQMHDQGGNHVLATSLTPSVASGLEVRIAHYARWSSY